MRQTIAAQAARLIAEEGVHDYGFAKRKAARQLGATDRELPTNAEVEEALQAWRSLYCDEEDCERLAQMRVAALEVMRFLAPFRPYVTGGVLEGTAGAFSEVELETYADTAKDVEIFLLNQHLDFTHSVPRTDRAEAVLTINDDDAVVNLIVYPANQERVSFKTRDGRIRQHARLDAVLKLIDAAPPEKR